MITAIRREAGSISWSNILTALGFLGVIGAQTLFITWRASAIVTVQEAQTSTLMEIKSQMYPRAEAELQFRRLDQKDGDISMRISEIAAQQQLARAVVERNPRTR